MILPIAVYVPLMFDEAIPLYVPEGTPAIVTLLAVYAYRDFCDE